MVKLFCNPPGPLYTLAMRKKSQYFLLIIAFVSGFSIMAMEISASRLLAPYFGSSLFVWTNIIGIVLIALSFGYYIGGKLADKIPQLNILLKIIFVSGILFLIIPSIIKPLASFININSLAAQPASAVIFISSLILTTILFAIPLFLLGMVSPFIIKLYSLAQVEKIGELSGTVFSISTIGSILGTFLPTLFFIPVLGTKTTIYIFAIILIFLGSFGFSKKKLRLMVFTLLPMTLIFSSPSDQNPDIIYKDESAYQYIRVAQDDNNTRYLIFNEGGGIQSAYNDKQVLMDMYYDYFNILPYLTPPKDKQKALIIGLAGGTAAHQLKYFFKDNIEIEGVEIDKKVIDISRKYFGLNDDIVKIYNQDGRMFLQNNTKKYSIIIVDAYAQEIYIPWTLTTKEFWRLVKNRLEENGIVAINVNSASADSDLLKSITNTMASIFKHVYITKPDENKWNYIIMAGQKELNFKNFINQNIDNRLQNLADIFTQETKVIKHSEDSLILTDDRAPIEFMTEAMGFNYLKNSIK